MENLIVIAAVLVVVGLAVGYVIREKRKGRKCIGCPGNCGKCSGHCDEY